MFLYRRMRFQCLGATLLALFSVYARMVEIELGHRVIIGMFSDCTSRPDSKIDNYAVKALHDTLFTQVIPSIRPEMLLSGDITTVHPN